MDEPHEHPTADRPATPARQALRQQGDLLPPGTVHDVARALFDQSPFSTVLYDAAGRILAANGAFERLFGVPASEIPADYCVLTDPQLESAGLLPEVRRAFRGEAVVLPPVRYEASVYDTRGRTSWTQGHFFPVLTAAGEVSGVLLVHVDLTQRVQAEDARRQGEHRLRVALDAGQMGSWEWEMDSGAVHWSDTLQRIHGVEPGTFGGTFDDFQALLHPEDREHVLETTRRSVDGSAHHLEYRIVRPDGVVRWLEARGEVFREPDGRPSTMLGICTDVTDRRLAEAEAATVRQRLEEQAVEMEAQTQQLQVQASELQSQQVELEQQAEELQFANEQLHHMNEELTEASSRAESAREDAQRAEAYVRGILQSIGDPFVVHDAEWRFQFVNDPAAAIFARAGRDDPETLLGRTLWELYPDLLGSATEREMRRAKEERVSVSFTEFYAATGTWSEMRCYPMPGGGLATLWKDVTERKQAEEAEHYLSRASELLAESLDRDETVQKLAQLLVPRLADWCTVQLVEEDGELRQVAVAHVDRAKVQWAVELNARYPADPEAQNGAHQVVRTGEPMLLREIPDELLVHAARDAEHLRILREIGFASALTVPLRARGEIIGTMSLVAAESGRRYGEAELALAGELARRAAMAIDNAALYGSALRAREEADDANRAKAEFLTTMSHELRTPLNAIGGYVQLIEMEVHGPVTDPQRDALARVQRSQQHLLSLINDVLNFAKLEAGRVTYDVDAVPVSDLLGGLEPLVAPQLAARSMRYVFEPVDDRLTIQGDPEKTQQILLNLLANAIKFTSEGGTIRVAAEADGASVRITVSDTGAGVPADRLEAIFEPFVQLSRSATSGHGGTGLGLAISRDLARGMGGDLTVNSVVGEGSTFTITLPRT